MRFQLLAPPVLADAGCYRSDGMLAVRLAAALAGRGDEAVIAQVEAGDHDVVVAIGDAARLTGKSNTTRRFAWVGSLAERERNSFATPLARSRRLRDALRSCAPPPHGAVIPAGCDAGLLQLPLDDARRAVVVVDPRACYVPSVLRGHNVRQLSSTTPVAWGDAAMREGGIYVHTVPNDSYAYDGPLLDAMAAGMAVVGPALGALAEVAVWPNASTNEQADAEAMKLARSDEYYGNSARRSRVAARQLTWERIAERWTRV